MRRSQEIVEDLARRMADGELAPGDRLPAERSLAESFGVSRGVVRHLAAQGAVESRRGAGAYVREAPGAGLGRALAGGLARGMGDARQRLAHLFAFRRVLETGMAELAARHATARDLEILKALAADQHRRLLHEGEAAGDADLDAAFHLALARATGNPVFTQALRALSPLLAETRAADLLTPQRRAASAKHHLRILDAVIRRDPAAARQAMDRHLRAAELAAAASNPEPPTP
jgi:GntR family transcriptional repressor for pyruvate dehydrogenase complex